MRHDSHRWPWVGDTSSAEGRAAQTVMWPCQKARHSRMGRDCQKPSALALRKLQVSDDGLNEALLH